MRARVCGMHASSNIDVVVDIHLSPPHPALTTHAPPSHTQHTTAVGYAGYKYLDQNKAPATAALDAAEAESRWREEAGKQPLTVRGILASLGLKPETVDRMMLTASLGGVGGGGGAGAAAVGGKVSGGGGVECVCDPLSLLLIHMHN